MHTNSSTPHQSLATKIEALQNGLDPKRADALLDEMIRLAGEHGRLTCTVADNRILRVESGDTILREMPIRLAKTKLRSLCARLAVRCQEWTGQELSLYGDTVEFEHPETKLHCKVYFENAPGGERIDMENTTVSVPHLNREEEHPKINNDFSHLGGIMMAQHQSLQSLYDGCKYRFGIGTRGEFVDFLTRPEVCWLLTIAIWELAKLGSVRAAHLLYNDIFGKKDITVEDVQQTVDDIELRVADLNDRFKKQERLFGEVLDVLNETNREKIAEILITAFVRRGHDRDKAEKAVNILLDEMTTKSE